jgi:hypothetical protein
MPKEAIMEMSERNVVKRTSGMDSPSTPRMY